MKKDDCAAVQCTPKLTDKRVFDSAEAGYGMKNQPDDEIAIQTPSYDHNL